MVLHIDFETYSPIDLKVHGLFRYVEDVQVHCMAYAFDNGPVLIWIDGLSLPREVHQHVSSGGTVAGHNVMFEYMVWNNARNTTKWPELKLSQLKDTAAKAAYYALPRSLEHCAKALDLPVQKDMDGHRAMLKLCRPKRKVLSGGFHEKWSVFDCPEEYMALYEYCKNDVEVERLIDQALPDLPIEEQRMWVLDAEINSHGLLLDMDTVRAFIDDIDRIKERNNKRCIELTKHDLTQVSKLASWMRSARYLDAKGMSSDDVKRYLADPRMARFPQIREMLELRQENSKTSVMKYHRMEKAVCRDNRLRGMFLYYGANTGRWAGRIVQLQNLPRGSVKDVIAKIEEYHVDQKELTLDEYSSLIRPMIIAPQDTTLLIADYSGIEARICQWVAGDEDALEVFRKKEDVYVHMARLIFDKDDIGKPERFVGKVAILGLGYGMGAAKFGETCESYGNPISEDLAKETVIAYRSLHEKLVSFWRTIEDHCIYVIRNQGQIRKIPCGCDIHVRTNKDFLQIRLPSGRLLNYYKPNLNGDRIEFMGTDTFTRNWQVCGTWGGKLTENIVQAISRDLLAEAMKRLTNRGYVIVGHVHDEIICESQPGQNVDEMIQIMCELPTWAAGAPIDAAGFESKRFRK